MSAADDDLTSERERLERLFVTADTIIDAGFDALPVAIFPRPDGTLEKVPLLRHGHLEAHRDRQLIHQQLVSPPHVPKGVPDNYEMAVGFVPGSGGCGVLDCDVKKGKGGKETYRALVDEHGEFVNAAWRSPSNGRNILFRKPKGARYNNRSPWVGIDVRADGGWVVAPGNITSWGCWTWKRGGYTTAVELPKVLSDQLTTSSSRERKATNTETVAFIEASPTSSAPKALEAFEEELVRFRSAGVGSRHDALLRIVGWAWGMQTLDLRDAMTRIKTEWWDLTLGEGREDEVSEVACWVTGQERTKRDTETGDETEDPDSEKPGRKSVASQLVELALDRYRLGCSDDGMVFAVELQGPNLALNLRGRGGLRPALAARYYEANGKAPGQNPLSEAMLVIEGKAMNAPREPVALRMARHTGNVVLDLGRADGKVMVISTSRWDVVDRSPVLFRRTEAIGELPLPVHTQDLSLRGLRVLFNVGDEDWPLIVAWEVAALICDIAHPVLFFSGEQGSAKTSAARLSCQVFDGVRADVQSVPRREDDWAVMAAGSWSIALDNVSDIPGWLSDAICRAVTGAQWRKRSLYSDDGLSILRIKRVISMNGIAPTVARGDLAERTIPIELEPITDRKTDEEIEAAFVAAHPEILGSLGTLGTRVLNELRGMGTPQLRMADYAKVLTAVDRVLGTNGLDRYRTMVTGLVAEAAEGDHFAQLLIAYLEDVGTWTGAAKPLLRALQDYAITHAEPWTDGLPSNPTAVGAALARLAPSLRAKGFTVNQERRKSGGSRPWHLRAKDKGNGYAQGSQGSQGSP